MFHNSIVCRMAGKKQRENMRKGEKGAGMGK
jgi:hypothetical protein